MRAEFCRTRKVCVACRRPGCDRRIAFTFVPARLRCIEHGEASSIVCLLSVAVVCGGLQGNVWPPGIAGGSVVFERQAGGSESPFRPADRAPLLGAGAAGQSDATHVLKSAKNFNSTLAMSSPNRHAKGEHSFFRRKERYAWPANPKPPPPPISHTFPIT